MTTDNRMLRKRYYMWERGRGRPRSGLSLVELESVSHADAELEVMGRAVRDNGWADKAARGVADADDRVARVEADDRACGRIDLKNPAYVERKVVVARATSLTERRAAAVETRSDLANEHHAGPRFGEHADASAANARLEAREELRLLPRLVVAEFCFGREAELRVDRKVLVEVIGHAPAEPVDRLAETF